MKLRIEKQLLDRARLCADEVDTTLSNWATRALRHYHDGKVKRVAIPEKRKNATRTGSVVCTLPGDQSQADEMRAALEAAVIHCEKVRVPPVKISLVAGRDYVVAKGEW